jgi:malonyl-CoA decarboxylase
MSRSFFGNLLLAISERGRGLLARDWPAVANAPTSDNLADLCERLLSDAGEASGVALAAVILDEYAALDPDSRIDFFTSLAVRFGADATLLDRAVEAWRKVPTDMTAAELHAASEPRRHELFRRLNLAPGGTRALVRMREHLLDAIAEHSQLRAVDDTFVHLFSSWFNRGFLVLRKIDWSTPASTLEKIIRYEAVHEIRDWDDLRRRIDPPDRRCYAFFHPALADEPLIFVEVAFEREIPRSIAPILASDRRMFVEPNQAKVAVFYSISNCQRGLAGVSFGNFLIKRVVEEIGREMPNLSRFVTLSPAPNFAFWLDRELAVGGPLDLHDSDRKTLALLEQPKWWTDRSTLSRLEEPLLHAAAHYYMRAKTPRGLPVDAVARFHLGNGARLERLNFLGDISEKGIAQAHGLMVNYLYDLDHIERNHEAFAGDKTIVASSLVTKLLPPARDVAHASK